MSGFQFKQFYVAHDRCAMKVSTDSIVLGSWTRVGEVRRILDIGCGSGLLALMLAQRAGAGACIDGIDVDGDAVAQATVNVSRSPWADNVSIYDCALQGWQPTCSYDVIVANPPYFPEGQRFAAQRQVARHRGRLNWCQLVDGVSRLLSHSGTFWLILPYREHSAFAEEARSERLHCQRQLLIRSDADKPVKLIASAWSWQPGQAVTESLCIKTRAQQYTPAYRALCRDYYLKF